MSWPSDLPVLFCAEYDAAAQWCAERGLKGEIGDPLPANMGSPGALDYIQADPEAFQTRVRQCAYALAMGRRENRCPTCGANNPIVNFCGCDPNNLPTKLT